VYDNATRPFTHAQALNLLMSKPRISLPIGTRLDCYRVVKLIGSGGFSLIYLAEDMDEGGEVVIKEFMPKKFARRNEHHHVVPLTLKATDNLSRSRKLFFQEIQALVELRHPNIVEILAFFRAYSTGYMVMEYFRGKNLASYIRQRKGGLSTRFITQVFFPILDALSMIHERSYLHLDIKPSNIHLRAGQQPLLLDFGAVHQVDDTNRRKTSRVITAGYSPVEQYYQGGYVGPWSDVYAIGASLRACIEGKTPPPAVDRHKKDTLIPASEAFGDRYPMFLLQAIDWSMEMDPQQRPQNAGELYTALKTQRGRPAPGTRFRPPGPNAHAKYY